jgi:hypothetical protein
VDPNVEEVRRGGATEILEYLHRKLDVHFRHLHESRQQLEPTAPVFALEHDLSDIDLELLKTAVRLAVAQGFGIRIRRQWWLPFVIYAAESGYDYVGDEYWPSFEAATPSWRTYGDRERIKAWFVKFANDYGGAVPTGAFAQHFTIISWPITHAVLPTYLQRQLAELLYGFRTGLTTDLLNDPAALGAKLASRSGGYTERFHIFCENTALLGQVAAALLSGDDEESPYLVRSTLDRLVDSLSRERQSQLWLSHAKQSASRVRTSGFRSRDVGTTLPRRGERLPAATDPKLFLRREGGAWRAYAELPDLTSLQGRLPHLYDELRTSRARIAGLDGRPLATGRLVYPGQEVRLTSWPGRETPFIQLERGSAPVNALLADQCTVSPGPWWMFPIRTGGPAPEIKGKSVRPGHSYCLIGERGVEPPSLTWITEAVIDVDGVRAFELAVPSVVSDAEAAGLTAAGISVLAEVTVRPVGLVASSWDGEGTVEWLAGEPAIVAVHAERPVDKCIVSIDGDLYVLAWPEEQADLFVALDGLSIGNHDVTATLLAPDGGDSLAIGSLLVTIRDPQVRPDGATPGEGIRLQASPARPTLAELWDGRATLSIAGPPQSTGDLWVILRNTGGGELGQIRHRVDLPMSSGAWTQFASRELQGRGLRNSYDEAESCEVAVSRAGVGYASLVCERGFRSLRWVILRRHGGHAARLIDRSDRDSTKVEFFPVDSPLSGTSCALGEEIKAPPRGGLLQATTGRTEASVILPPDPNQLWMTRNTHVSVQVGDRTMPEVTRLLNGHRNWLRADLPADPFARYQQKMVLDAIVSALISLIAGGYWAALERKLGEGYVIDHLEEVQSLVGVQPSHRALAKRIADSLWRWSDSPSSLTSGFAEVIADFAARAGVNNRAAARFLLKLASNPGRLVDWDFPDQDPLLEHAMRSPVLVRAARFAVLGTEALRSGAAGTRAGGLSR